MKQVENKNSFSIAGWMVNDLHLADKELILYAIIYGFTQDGASTFFGGLSYLSQWIGKDGNPATRATTIKTLKSLVDKKLIERIEEEKNGVLFVNYRATNIEHPVQEMNTLCSKTEHITINEYKYNNNNNKESSRFVKPSIDEIAYYCMERQNGIDAAYFFDYYESKGWKVGNSPMKDWKATIRTWERKEKVAVKEKKVYSAPQEKPCKADIFRQNMIDVMEGRL